MKSIHAELGPATEHRQAKARALRIAIVGSGYVGLVTAACLADCGHDVTAIDADEAKVARLAAGEVTLYEAGLSDLVRAQMHAGRLRFTTEPALHGLDLVFIAVGTPDRGDGSPEMGAVNAVVDCIADTVRAPTVVVIKSTVPVGTARSVQARLTERCGADEDAAQVLSNPEFLREGSAVADFMAPERILIGDDGAPGVARSLLIEAYAPLVNAGVPVLTMDTCSAELSKQAANAMLAVRISFVNEVAAIAGATGADIEQVRIGIGSDHRIGAAFLQAGLGYGGSCFPKDVAALRATARHHKLRSDLLQATQRVNDRQRCWAFRALQRDVGSREQLRGLRVAVWGLAFKPGTDDMRCAPSLGLVESLVRAGIFVAVYDPAAMANARPLLQTLRRVEWAPSASAALEGADALMLVTEWSEFTRFDPRVVASALRMRTVYDGRNALDAHAWARAGLRVLQVGRPATPSPALQREAALTEAVQRANEAAPMPAGRFEHEAANARALEGRA